ncbi:hypothetical protein SUGI_0080300 [Cryptomeria japonica]|nr:hypothetical protein SUGI_0080300 [Cryptomeria japonica]
MDVQSKTLMRPSGDTFQEGNTESRETGEEVVKGICVEAKKGGSQREAKVPDKLLPLLECLRVSIACKFGSIFKQRLQAQVNVCY